MTFTITGKDEEQFGMTTILRCDVCDGQELVYDEREDEQAKNEAERVHECPPRCLACDEPLAFNDQIIGARVCMPCWRDQPREAALALGAFIEARKQEVA